MGFKTEKLFDVYANQQVTLEEQLKNNVPEWSAWVQNTPQTSHVQIFVAFGIETYDYAFETGMLL